MPTLNSKLSKPQEKKYRPPFKTSGGKYYLSKWIIEHFPEEHEKMAYIEPFVGAGSVFLNKQPSHLEAINDLNVDIIQVFRALRDEPKAFISRLKRTNYTEMTFNRAKNRTKYKDYMEHAINEFLLRRMSRAGLKRTFLSPSQEELNAWDTIVADLPRLADRLKNVFIFCKSAVDVIRAWDDKDFLCYCDPPTLDEEWDADQHIDLAGALYQYRGKVIISAKNTTLYRRLYKDWKCSKRKHSHPIRRARSRQVECLWFNY